MTIQEVQEQIIEDFSAYDEWLDKYEYLIELGKNLTPFAEELKTDERLIKGCQSRVWLDAKLQDFSIPQDSADETFENQEQIEISKSYEQLPKATLIATQEFIEDQLIYRGSNRDDVLK